jgi:hypothetical protein
MGVRYKVEFNPWNIMSSLQVILNFKMLASALILSLLLTASVVSAFPNIAEAAAASQRLDKRDTSLPFN